MNLREIARAATPGPWAADDKGVFTVDEAGPVAWVGDAYPRGDNHPAENMAHIAAWSPDRALATLDVIEAARAYRSAHRQWGPSEVASTSVALRDALARWDALRETE